MQKKLETYDSIPEGFKVRSRILWNKEGEKLSTFFFNFKKKAVQYIIKKLETENKDTWSKLYKQWSWFLIVICKDFAKSLSQVNNFFENITVPVLA